MNVKSKTLKRVGAVGAATMLGVAAFAVAAPAASAAWRLWHLGDHECLLLARLLTIIKTISIDGRGRRRSETPAT
ncbi:hypothetical protein ABH924_003427 [Arthrobacter sp. GAS37]